MFYQTNNFSRNPSLINENHQFALKVKEAIKVVETILDNTRNPVLASPNHEHSYNDKYTLSEFITNTAVTSFINVLDKMGLGGNSNSNADSGEPMDEGKPTDATVEALRKMTSLVQDDKKSITLRFVAKESCSFVCENEIEIESPHSMEEESKVTGPSGIIASTVLKRKVKTKIKECHWKIEIEYGIYLYAGGEAGLNDTNSIPIITNTISSDLVTRTSKQPFAPSVEVEPVDVSLTWLLQTLNKDTFQSEFKIKRENPTCRTPRNNDDIFEAWKFFTLIGKWCARVNQYFIKKDRQILEKDNHDKDSLDSISGNGIFLPVLPLLETLKEDGDNQSPMLSNEDVNLFLNKQYLTMTENIESLQNNFTGQVMSPVEAVLVLLTKHSTALAQYYFSGVNHIEDMLHTQLYNAIGKHVNNDDLDEFVRSYNQKLFADTYAPESFCYTVRRPGYFPDGLISIEKQTTCGRDKGGEKNAMTFTRQLETSNGENPMYIPINSATSVQFTGNLFLHAWMMQRFQQSHPSFHLASRARQFSSFLLLVGKLSGPNTFEPEHGIILQNQDEVLIPLLLEEMPSAKEFKDAIDSLSPEQQQFAIAFRNMKLSSSVFGVCVVQLKPQLEKLLGLPERSLTKEIRLTQSLLSLFIDYQVPSDLLSFDGDVNLDAAAKVEVVKGHVKNVEDMVEEIKQRDMKKVRMEADMAHEHHSTDNPFGGGLFAGPAVFKTGSVPSPAQAQTRFGAAFGESPPMDTMAMSFSQSTASSVASSARSMSKKKSAPKRMHHHQEAMHHQPQIVHKPHHLMHKESVSNPQNTGTFESPAANKNSNNNHLSKPIHSNDHIDLTMIPKQLDSKFEMFGNDEKYGGALRSTTIKAGDCWSKKRKQNILSKLETIALPCDVQRTERQKAFDLLDALSRSGVVPMSHAELHVVIASTHCFDKSVVNTVIQDNINPIEKIERSHLLVASIVHNANMKELLSNEEELDRICNHSPMLMIDMMSEEGSMKKMSIEN